MIPQENVALKLQVSSGFVNRMNLLSWNLFRSQESHILSMALVISSREEDSHF